MDTYRPTWAAAMGLETRTRTHIRKGWDFLKGFRAYCGANPKTPKDFWLTREEILGTSRLEADAKPLCSNCQARWTKSWEENS